MKQDIFQITEDKEVRLWKESIFIFDSSALLNFYFLPEQTRLKVFNEIFEDNLKERLWSPSQVHFEYYKNREKVIRKPIIENYKPLKDDNLKKIRESIKTIDDRVNDLKNRTKSDEKHPHLKQELIDEYCKRIGDFKKLTGEFEDNIIKEIKEIENEIDKLPENDDVKAAYEKYFAIGREYSYEEILDITKEGKHRFEFKIPPGYGDLYKKVKKGTQIFGDLIIWKQILEYSKEKKMPIIFITDDISKDEDWCYLDKKNSEDRILAPREELVKELYDNSGVELWMYNLPQFLFLSNKYLKSTIKEEIIQNISSFLTNTSVNESGYLKFKCDRCGTIHTYGKSEIELDFECIDSQERGMGNEYQHLAEVHFECECGNLIEAAFEVWEYPQGAHNYDSVELEGAKLLECFYFTIDFHADSFSDICEKCGEEYNLETGTGLCGTCEEEYNQK